MNDELKVSVIIPVYNAAEFIEKAVLSALQLVQTAEVILVEDGSKDTSLLVCQRLAKDNDRVKLFSHPNNENRGVSHTRNLGIQMAQSPWIAFLDADDLYLPNRFDAEQRLLNADSSIDGVYGALGSYYAGSGERSTLSQFQEGKLTTIHKTVAHEDLKWVLMDFIPKTGYFSIVGLTIRKSAIMQSGFFPHMRWGEDTVFLIRLSFASRIEPGIIDHAVALRGVHDNNSTLANPKFAATREQVYAELITWARNKNFPQKFIQLLQAKQLSFVMANRDKLSALFLFIKECMSNKYFRRYSYFFNTAADALFPKKLAQFIIRLKEAYYVRIKRWNTDNTALYQLLQQLNEELSAKH
jgi:glycosyltransferase involved in cell wall biosynthesis